MTLEGIDPATGRTRWKQDVGSVQALYGDGTDVIRTGPTTYTLQAVDGLVTLDLDRGIRPGSAEAAGWCAEQLTVTPAEKVVGVLMGDPADYRVDVAYPCRINSSWQDRPTRPAGFAGATVDGVFAYTDVDGKLRAVRTS